MRPFSCAKTCSTAERTLDLRPLAIRVASGMGRPFGFLTWMRETKPRFDEVCLVLGRAIGRVRPDVACSVVLIEQRVEPGAVMRGGVRHGPTCGSARGDGRCRYDFCSRKTGSRCRPSSPRPHAAWPWCIFTVQRAHRDPFARASPVFAFQSSGMRPSLIASFSACVFPLLRRSDDGGVDDLTAHSKIARRLHRGIEPLEQDADSRLARDRCARQRLAETSRSCSRPAPRRRAPDRGSA